jgi:methyl-accepting chemotaxis protein
MKGLSIQTKILALLLFLIIAPSILLTGISYTISSNSLYSEIINSMESATLHMENTLNLFFKGYESAISTLASDEHLRTFSRQSASERQASSKILENYLQKYEDLNLVYFATSNNELYIYPPVDLGADFKPSERPWYQAAAAGKGPIWTDPMIDMATGSMIITVAEAVYNTNNEFVGVVGADLVLDELTQTINAFRIGQKGYFILTNDQGNIITHPQTDKIGQPLTTQVLREAAASGIPSGFKDYVYNGERKLAKYTTLERTGWKIFGTLNYSEISEKTSTILINSIIIMLIVIVTAILMGILFSRPIIKGIKTLSRDMGQISHGDFTVRSQVKSKDEVGLLSSTLSKMCEDLGGIITKIKGLANEVSDSSNILAATSEESTATTEEIARTIGEIVKVTEDQAYSTEEGLKRTTLLADIIQNISQEIQKISYMIKDSSTMSIKGKNSVIVLKEKAETAHQATAKMGDVVLQVDRSADQINVIVDTISAMASQTNLLALNASIEAARAGEAGRGFAVVAEEIRKLAEQSAEASNNIRDLIREIQTQSNNAVATMDDTKPIIEEQNKAVLETTSAFDEIYTMIEKLGEEIALINEMNENLLAKKDEILTTMESISASAEQTSASTQQISASTHEQLAATDEVAKTAEHLNLIAQNLAAEISKFKV